MSPIRPRSILASGNPQRVCDQCRKGHYRVTVIDIVKEPELAREHEILATPTLVRVLPGPEKTVVGVGHRTRAQGPADGQPAGQRPP